MKYVIIAALAFWVPHVSVLAQSDSSVTSDTVAPKRGSFTFGGGMFVPRGDLGETAKKFLSFGGRLAHDVGGSRRVRVLLEGGVRNADARRQMVPLLEQRVHVNTANRITHGSVGIEVRSRSGEARPYALGTIGVMRIHSEATAKDAPRLGPPGPPFNASVRSSDGGVAWTIGTGLVISTSNHNTRGIDVGIRWVDFGNRRIMRDDGVGTDPVDFGSRVVHAKLSGFDITVGWSIAFRL
jgi:hypothetical protein